MAAQHVQDLPPAGGFKPITYAKNLPRRGPHGVVLFAVVIGVMAWGFSRVIAGNQRRRCADRLAQHTRVRLSLAVVVDA